MADTIHIAVAAKHHPPLLQVLPKKLPQRTTPQGTRTTGRSQCYQDLLALVMQTDPSPV